MNRDIYQKIASLSDDKTALLVLGSIKEMDKDIYYLTIFGNRYPDLIKYKNEDEPTKKLYLRMLEIIKKLKEQFKYNYASGNPELQLGIFEDSGGNIDDLLFIAAGNGSLELVKYALEHGANIHARYDSALRLASENGHLEVVKFLVKNKANIHALDDSALVLAIGNGYLEVVKVLIENGANLHTEDDFGLRLASGDGFLEVVKYLVEQGADIHAMEDQALRLASENGHLGVVKYLKEQMKNE